MYQNRIRRITPNNHPQFFIRRSEIAFDEKLPFIESVLETLIESRFGPGGVYQSVLRSSDRPELEPAPLYDYLFDDELYGPVPCYTLSPQGRITRAGCLRSEFFGTQDLRAKEMQRLNAGPNARIPRLLSHQTRDAARRDSQGRMILRAETRV